MKEIAQLCRPDIYAMEPYSSARVEGSQKADILVDANENPYPPYPASEGCQGLNRYPEPQPAHLLERFAELFERPIEQLFISRGADEAIDLLVRAFCEAHRDGILITPPTFVMYETSAAIQGATVHRVPLVENDNSFALDVEAVLAECDARPEVKLVFVCSPNNPTANLLDRADIVHIAERLIGRCLVVVDELYVDYSGSRSLCSELDAHPNLVILRSMSKAYSLAGERIGVTVAHPETIAILRRIMAPYSLTITSVRAVTEAISEAGMAYGKSKIEAILSERKRVCSALEASPHVQQVFHSDANFLLFRTTDASMLTEVMQSNGIKVRNRSSVVSDSVRLSIGTPDENDRILAVFDEYQRKLG